MKKKLCLLLAVLIVVSLLPTVAMAESVSLDMTVTGCEYYNLIEKNDYVLAPGAQESEIIINSDDGNQRQVVHVIEVDLKNPNISVMPTTRNISGDVDYTSSENWGPQEMTKQAAHVENDLGLNVVGGMNVSLSWDFTHPYGLLMYEGKVLHDSREACELCGNDKKHPGGGYLAIKKDGTAELRAALDPIEEDDWMAQTVCFSYIVKDGQNLSATENHASDPAPRSVIGLKADGTLVLMMVDGRMAPYSTGFNTHEMADMMLKLGCVTAINCDGGGSSTFLTEREGTGELSVKSRFSDGSERPTLSGILVLSKAVADGKFDHAAIDTEAPLVTPGSTVQFTATGADSAGGPAEIPADVTWQLTDPSMGTVENGVFVSSGKTGTATVQMVCNGNVVGEDSVDVVIPDSLSFVQSNITAPYTKSVALDLIAKYGYTEVVLKNDDITYTLSDAEIGTISGKTFTATADETVTGGFVTATLTHNTALTATANITLGKGSEIVYDFESGADSIANWSLAYKDKYLPSNYYFNDTLSVVSATEGEVRNGNYALKVTCDGDSITCMNWCQTRINGLGIDLKDAVSLSFWMYIPEDSHGYEWDFGNAIPVGLGHWFKYGTGWQYFTVNVADIGSNVTSLNQIRLYHSDTSNPGNGYVHSERPNYYADTAFYIDDITVNYSSAVEDFDAPVITNACVSHANIDTPVAMTGQDINNNVVAFTAFANDNVENANYTGLNKETLAVYVDGVRVNATCSDNGMISTGDMTLANGVHTVRFEIADNRGNVTPYYEYSVNITGDSSKNTINYVPADPSLKDVGVDSLVWMNLEATAIENVSKVTTTIDLDANSKWQLDYMELADGFTASYTVNAENNAATITVTRTGTVAATGEAVLASLPIRVWSPAFPRSDNEDTFNYRLVSVISYVRMGSLEEQDGTKTTFASAQQTTSTEYNDTRLTSAVDKSSWHEHTPEAVEDKAPTCLKTGYTGRTFCAECNSVVDWGTTVPATGHTYAPVDGMLTCSCGETLNQNGLITLGENTYYAVAGKLSAGWIFENDSYYYFDPTTYAAVDGEQTLANGFTYTFENKILVRGYVQHLSDGMRYNWAGSWVKNQWQTIDGAQYYFKSDARAACGTTWIKIGKTAPKWYRFTDTGELIEPITTTGLFQFEGKTYYLVEGEMRTGLIKAEDGYFYYFSSTDYAAVINTVYHVRDYGEYPEYAGGQTFDAQGRMVIKAAEPEEEPIDPTLKNGIYTEDGVMYYYRNNVKYYAGLVVIDGDYYYVNSSCKVVTGTYHVSKYNEYPEYEGSQMFGADGKMVVPDAEPEEPEIDPTLKNGIVTEDGVMYYYVNDVKTYAGLIVIDGDFYYVNSSCKVVTGNYYVSKYNEYKKYEGGQMFGADGKMVVPDAEPEEPEIDPTLKNGIVTEDGVMYYYVNGVKTYAGLIMIDGDYYYVNSSCKVVTGNYYVSKYNEYKKYEGGQMFGADGKMVVPDAEPEEPEIDPTLKNGIVTEDGVMYYYVNGVKTYAGLIMIDGDYYYVNSSCKVVTGNYYVSKYNEYKKYEGGQMFGSDGKMVVPDAEPETPEVEDPSKNGIITEDGVMYYYVNGVKTYAGLIMIDGDYYYVNSSCKVVTGKYYVSKHNGLQQYVGSQMFGSDGKMVIE